MHLSLCKKQRFEPNFRDNLSLPPAERIVVRYDTPSTTSRVKVTAPSQAVAKADNQGRVGDLEIRIGDDNEYLIMDEHKVAIENLSYEDEKGNKVNVVNTRDLFNAPTDFGPLIKEIVKKIKNHFTEVPDEKNSE